MIVALLPLCSGAQGSWERVAVPTGRTLRAMSFADSVTGWVAADSGLILHTENGGKNWEVQQTGTFADVASIFFYNKNLGWAACNNYRNAPYGTILLKTVDSGITWVPSVYPQENIFMSCILFLDSLNGWMGGKPHALLRTHDGGATWAQASIDTSTLAFFPVLNIAFYNENIGFAGGGMFDIAGVVWRTTDGGNHWSAIEPAYAPADEVHALHIFDSLNVLGAGGDPDFGFGVGLIRTADCGVTWSYRELGIQGNAYDIAFRNDREVWAPLGPRRRMIVSLDGSVTWNMVPTPDSTAIYKMKFPDTLHGYAIGLEGAFLRYRASSVGLGQEVASTVGPCLLGQNYPNPFREETVVSLTLPFTGRNDQPGNTGEPIKEITIKVFDVWGKEVARQVTRNHDGPEASFRFDGADFLPGVYFYKVEISGKSADLILPVCRSMIRY